eukprot:Skav235425  [mRNA]  locus=scaffold924:581231:582244:+ [translate_table: standard]
MGSELVALRALGLKCKDIFCQWWSEKDEKKRAVYQHVHKYLGFPRATGYKDLTTRNHEFVDDVDIYISGFPCQPMSTQGKQRGVRDVRGHIGFHCLQVVIYKRPMVSIFENVKGMLQKKHKRFTDLFRKVLKECGYKVYMKVLNTLEYGIPQSRPRVYIVAIHEDAMQYPFKWPKPFERFDKKALGQLIQREERGNEVLNISTYEQKYGKEVWKHPYILDVNASKRYQSARCCVCPCLTYSRLNMATPGYYIPALKRRINLLECGRLQGMPDDLMHYLKKNIADDKDIGAALGDGMSVNVLSKVLTSVLISIGTFAESHRGEAEHWREGRPWTRWHV